MSSLDHVQLVMGTGVRYALRGVADEEAGRQALASASAWLDRVERVFSTYRPDSAVTRLREDRAVEVVDLPLVEEVLDRCGTAYVLTDGWFDPWSVPGGFDPSAFVKGWSLEQVGRLLAPVCTGFLVDAGGDLLVHGVPEPGRSWSVGIRHPLEAAAVAAVLALADPASTGTAVATSGAYARGEHVVDPRTGRGAARLLSATVVGPDPGLADALATALFVEGLDGIDRIVDLPAYAAFLVDLDQHTWASPGLPLQAAS
ncbi:MAG TPA: FAD:protein FMN transferase [Candidatus Limnocylindria bacterium]|nr:FAD:protein FMN transferase [Candidatus Limnocylindria bacterium]